jgi:hypothetical protein
LGSDVVVVEGGAEVEGDARVGEARQRVAQAMLERHGGGLLEVDPAPQSSSGGREADVEAERDGWGNTECDVKQLELRIGL